MLCSIAALSRCSAIGREFDRRVFDSLWYDVTMALGLGEEGKFPDMDQNNISTSDPGGKSKPAHIMIVEDDPIVAKTVCDILETFRGDFCNVIRSKHVAEEHIRRQQPDLVILDYKLLGGSSSVLARLASNMRIPAILMSGHNVAEKAEALNFPFLEKPFSAEQLLNLVSTLLQK